MAISENPKKSKSVPRKTIKAKFDSSVLQMIRQHARSSSDHEICGVLIGETANNITQVMGAIAGESARQGNTHVTFTQETWNKIHEKKSEQFPALSIVGWYHSHPGFGVFLSEHDLFIHNNFFSDPGHLAWVYDPQSDEEGCFGWVKDKVDRLQQFEVIFNFDKKFPPQKANVDYIPNVQQFLVPQSRVQHSKKAYIYIIISLCVLLFLVLILFILHNLIKIKIPNF